jgi:hypothetical protein
MAGGEPANLREWAAPVSCGGRLFTCGRPGRSAFGRKKRPIDKDTIDLWVKGLPDAKPLDIVSLLGKKKSGFSEFEYYPFRSSQEAGTKPTFQQWLDKHYYGRFRVHEFPTVDAQGIPSDVLMAVTRYVLNLIERAGPSWSWTPRAQNVPHESARRSDTSAAPNTLLPPAASAAN